MPGVGTVHSTVGGRSMEKPQWEDDHCEVGVIKRTCCHIYQQMEFAESQQAGEESHCSINVEGKWSYWTSQEEIFPHNNSGNSKTRTMWGTVKLVALVVMRNC
eukprot:Gb_06258 [translate_table: standard]